MNPHYSLEEREEIKKDIRKIEEQKVFINHGIYTYDPFDGSDIKVRNTNKHFPLPLKFRKTLNSYYLRWFHVQKTIKYHNREIRINTLLDGKIEFTVAHCPDNKYDTMVITLCYPFKDQFDRKEGVKWVRERMKEALIHPHIKVWWKWTLER